jgi:hypothetical protein
MIDSPQMDEDERIYVTEGAVSTLREIATKGNNEGHALRMVAKHLLPSDARQVRQTAKAYEGSAAMADQAADVLVARLNGSR